MRQTPSPTDTAARPRTGPAYLVLALAFFDNLSILPVLPDYAARLGTSPALIGLIVAAYSMTNLPGNVLFGHLADRYGRKPPLLIGLLGTALVLVGYTHVRSPLELLLLRALHGFTASPLTPAAVAAIADQSPGGETRARAAGRIGAVIGLVATLAPPSGGIIAERLGPEGLFWILFGLLIACILVVGIRFAETLEPITPGGPVPAPWTLLRDPRLLSVYTGALGLTFAMGVVTVYMPLLVLRAGYGVQTSGMAFGFFSLLAVLFMLLLRDRGGQTTVQWRRLHLGFLGLALGLLLLEEERAVLFGAMGLFGSGFGLLFPALTVLLQAYCPPGSRAAALGLFFALYSLGIILGQTSAGLFLEANLPPHRAASVLALLVSLLVGLLRRRG
jgi:DHA1 family multidrug resistance protein-like MFS transporter